MRAWLNDDVNGAPVRVAAGLDDDVFAAAVVEFLPTLTVRVRTRTGFDDDGDPEFEWTTVVEALAIVWEEREERDDLSGRTLRSATATIPYDGEVLVSESAMFESSDGDAWRCKAVAQFPDRLEVSLVKYGD